MKQHYRQFHFPVFIIINMMTNIIEADRELFWEIEWLRASRISLFLLAAQRVITIFFIRLFKY